MAEGSYLWDNPGTGDSPALGYGNSLFCQIIQRMLLNGTGNQGVLKNWLNELEVTDGGVDTATVLTGGAILYGVWYETDANVDVDINAYRGGNCLIVVRASWAAQTARIVARAVGALTQTAGVTYEIPLANVAINGAGAITLITDTRDFCEFSTDLWPLVITTDNLAADAATTTELIDQDRWIDRSSANVIPDATNPAAWISNNTVQPYRNVLEYVDAALSEGWMTFRVPTDFTGANIPIYLYMNRWLAGAGDIRWTYSAWIAAANGVLANSAGATLQTIALDDDGGGCAWLLNSLCSLAVNAGDIVHLQIGRDGAHAADTLAMSVYLQHVRAPYTADS